MPTDFRALIRHYERLSALGILHTAGTPRPDYDGPALPDNATPGQAALSQIDGQRRFETSLIGARPGGRRRSNDPRYG